MAAVCPICKAAIPPEPQAPPFRPFCSQRCKLADLDNWFSGAYRISTPMTPSDLDDDEVEPS